MRLAGRELDQLRPQCWRRWSITSPLLFALGAPHRKVSFTVAHRQFRRHLRGLPRQADGPADRETGGVATNQNDIPAPGAFDTRRLRHPWRPPPRFSPVDGYPGSPPTSSVRSSTPTAATAQAVAQLMDELETGAAGFHISQGWRWKACASDFGKGGRASEEETSATELPAHCRRLGEFGSAPHSAVGVHVAQGFLGSTPMVTARHGPSREISRGRGRGGDRYPPRAAAAHGRPAKRPERIAPCRERSSPDRKPDPRGNRRVSVRTAFTLSNGSGGSSPSICRGLESTALGRSGLGRVPTTRRPSRTGSRIFWNTWPSRANRNARSALQIPRGNRGCGRLHQRLHQPRKSRPTTPACWRR